MAPIQDTGQDKKDGNLKVMPPLNFARLQSFIGQVEKKDGLDNLEDSDAYLWYQQLSEVIHTCAF